LLKAIRSLETDRWGLEPPSGTWDETAILTELRQATDRRIYVIAEALRQGWPVERVCKESAYDPWFVEKIQRLVAAEADLRREPAEMAAMVRRVNETQGKGVQCAEL